jgi:hypothetical protein
MGACMGLNQFGEKMTILPLSEIVHEKKELDLKQKKKQLESKLVALFKGKC